MFNFYFVKDSHSVLLLVLASLLSGCATHKHHSQTEPLPAKQSLKKGPEIPLAKNGDIKPDAPLAAPSATLELSLTKVPSEKTEHRWLQTGRYRTLHAVPTEAQKDLLKVIIQITLPDEIQSIQSAIAYLLARSGYEFVAPPPNSAVAQLLTKPIPAVHRQLGPMTLQSALETLAGSSFKLTIDPIHRRLGYVLLPALVERGYFL